MVRVCWIGRGSRGTGGCGGDVHGGVDGVGLRAEEGVMAEGVVDIFAHLGLLVVVLVWFLIAVDGGALWFGLVCFDG